MRTVLALLLLATATSDVAAKCAARFHMISGVVFDAGGQPAANVVVGAAWIEQSSPGGPAMTLTDAHGRYAIPIEFQTYSGQSLPFSDQCDSLLREVSITAYTATSRSPSLLVPVGRNSAVEAAPLQIDRAIVSKSLWPDD
ncbi:MAG: carboxypeptidase-like regulatory domain-containing protein [Arenimonas sp.]